MYQFPLYLRGYHKAEMVREFLHDISTRKPTLIIDASTVDSITPPIDPVERRIWRPAFSGSELLPEMKDVFEYITSNYKRVTTLAEGHGKERWPVYEYVGRR